jgi:two-component sensor histidine kinase/integral membrane sensor domain MASE1
LYKKWFLLTIKCLIFLTAYFFFAYCGRFLSLDNGKFVNFWLPSGLYAGILFVSNKKTWPFLILSAIIGNISFDLYNGKPLWLTFLFSLGNTFEAVVGIFLFLKFISKEMNIDTVKNTIGFIVLNGIIATSISAFIGVLTLKLFFNIDNIFQSFFLWWSGDFMGVLIFSPMLISGFNLLKSPDKLFIIKKPIMIFEFFILILLIILSSYFIFTGKGSILINRFYLIIPLFFWAAIRFNLHFTMILVFITSIIAAICNSNGLPAFSHVLEKDPIMNYVNLNLYLCFISIFSLIISGIYYEKKEVDKIIKNNLFNKEILLKEIHHRIKNNLNILESLIGLESTKIKDENSKVVLNDIKNRIFTISLIHNKLYNSEDISTINLKQYFETLNEAIYSNYNINNLKINYKITAGEYNLSLNKLIPLGLLSNEIIVNIYKHAFKGRMEGIIEIILEKIDKKYTLKIKDNGVGMSEKQYNDPTSLGHLLIKGLAEQINAEIILKIENGTEYKIIFNE